jgi:hypothetical protein
VNSVSNIRILWSMTLGIVLWRMWKRYQESKHSIAPATSYRDGKDVGGQQKVTEMAGSDAVQLVSSIIYYLDWVSAHVVEFEVLIFHVRLRTLKWV